MLLNFSYSWPTINCGHSGHAIFAYYGPWLIVNYSVAAAAAAAPPWLIFDLKFGECLNRNLIVFQQAGAVQSLIFFVRRKFPTAAMIYSSRPQRVGTWVCNGICVTL